MKPAGHDARGECAAILKHAHVIWQDPCRNGEVAQLCGSGPVIPSFETSPDGRRGEVSKPAKIASKDRGGARNFASRESDALSAAHVTNLIAAVSHANAIGLPLNRMITIHWERAGISLEAIPGATGRFIDMMAKAMSRHGSKTAWAFVHENGDRKGGHCHLLAHVASAMVPIVTGMQKRWLRRIADRPYRARVILSRPIGGRLGLETSNPNLYAENLAEVLAYTIKGADPDAARKFELLRLKPGGRVIGKRCGTSQNIGRKARMQFAERRQTETSI